MIKLCKVKGISMSPVFNEGDYVLSISRKLLKPNIGDCIIFRDDTYGCIIKQITRKQKKGFFVEGTHRCSMDSNSLGIIPFGNVIGKVVMRFPKRKPLKEETLL